MRAIEMPFIQTGSARVFTSSLPRAMELDTKILFTSFASQLNAAQTAPYGEVKRALCSLPRMAAND